MMTRTNALLDRAADEVLAESGWRQGVPDEFALLESGVVHLTMRPLRKAFEAGGTVRAALLRAGVDDPELVLAAVRDLGQQIVEGEIAQHESQVEEARARLDHWKRFIEEGELS